MKKKINISTLKLDRNAIDSPNNCDKCTSFNCNLETCNCYCHI